MSAFFDVCVKGFRGLMTAKPKWHFVRELISNSLDESSVNNIKLELIKESRFVTIICKDDVDETDTSPSLVFVELTVLPPVTARTFIF